MHFLVWALLLGSVARAQSPSVDPRGIYVYSNDVSQLSNSTAKAVSSALKLPGVDGIVVVIGWSAIEPAMGQYQWATLDQWIGQAAALGKRIDLTVTAGNDIPLWLFEPPPTGAGAKRLDFTISPHSGATGLCQPVTLAPPWDAAFLNRWDTMLAALAAHLKAAGTYDAITLLRLTGVNRTTEEIRLPAETAQSTGLACVSDAITTWQQAGYKPSLLLQGWTQIVASFSKSFPDKTFTVAIIPTNPFPAINESGAIIKGTPPDENLPLMQLASQKLPGRLIVMFDFLMPGEAASPAVVDYAQTLGTMAAFQTNEYFGQTGQGAACSEPVTNPTPCTAATFLDMLNTGIYPLGKSNPLRAQFIEVFQANANAFPDDLMQAHLELDPPTISLAANAEGEARVIAPNTWVEIKGSDLSLTETPRIWQGADFTGNTLPRQLDGVSATVNGKSAYVYFISPGQVNILTPPDAISGIVPVAITNNGVATASFTAQAQSASPSFFVFGAGPYVAATHAGGAYLGPASLYPPLTTPAKPGETVVLYGNGFGATSVPVVAGSLLQSGTLSPAPVIKIGGVTADVQFAGLVMPGEFQFNVVVPAGLPDGDQPITATYNGLSTQPGTLIAIQR